MPIRKVGLAPWYTTLYHRSSSAAAPPCRPESPRVPFVAWGMSLLETSSYIGVDFTLFNEPTA